MCKIPDMRAAEVLQLKKLCDPERSNSLPAYFQGMHLAKMQCTILTGLKASTANCMMGHL